jgi:hypothetical protein
MNSVIFVILSVISHCYSNSTISLGYRAYLSCSAIFTMLGHFMILLAIFHCYNTQSFLTAIVLGHFSVLQCSAICDPISHFRVTRTGSGSREGTRLDCVWLVAQLVMSAGPSCAFDGVARGTKSHRRGSVARMSRLVWVDRWVQVIDLWSITSITLGDK